MAEQERIPKGTQAECLGEHGEVVHRGTIKGFLQNPDIYWVDPLFWPAWLVRVAEPEPSELERARRSWERLQVGHFARQVFDNLIALERRDAEQAEALKVATLDRCTAAALWGCNWPNLCDLHRRLQEIGVWSPP